MKVAIIGANGFIGERLINYLLSKTNHSVLALCKRPEALNNYSGFGERFIATKVDVFDTELLEKSLNSVDVAFYLVHLMGDKSINFYEAESKAANSFGRSAELARVSRVVYLGGLGRDDDKLSKHLASRHKTGDILRSYKTPVIEFRAAIIVGEGSISFEIVKNLVDKLYIIPLPRFSKNLTQPIGIDDVLRYLCESINISITKNEILEIGGPQKMSYKDFVKMYANFINKKCILIRVPFVPSFLTGYFLYLFMPKKIARIGSKMIDSFKNTMVVNNNRAQEIFPKITTSHIQDFFNK